MDQSKKTMRHFYCRDVLWETFEQMANDFDCSIDYLINESMRYYAKSKSYQAPGGAAPAERSGASTMPAPAAAQPPPPAAPPPRTRPAPTTSPPAIPQVTARRPAASPTTPPPREARPAEAPAYAPPPGPAPATTAAGSVLFLVYSGQRYPVNKDQFIIGRGSKTSDLAIKDGNISRKHAAVIRRNGTFYIKDLGSTNGIDYKGMRIDNKRIDEGDVFHLCDYELRFTYRAE